MQIDNLSELGKDKRPPELMIWDGTSEEIDNWIDKVLSGKKEPVATLTIREDEIEG
jgi:hypothetical protein